MQSNEATTCLTLSCLHCGSAYQPTREDERFCCAGCELVHGLLLKQGLQDYYRLRDANPPICPLPVHPSSDSFDFCDDPSFITKMTREKTPSATRMSFYLEGVTCTACLWLLEKLPQFCSDATSARLNMANSTIEVERRADGSFASIARTLNRFGYRPHPIENGDSAKNFRQKENQKDLIRIGVAAACTGNIMILAVSLYGGADGILAQQFKWLTALLATPVLTYSAWPFYKNAWAGLRSRQLNLDVPIVAALLAGIVFSIWGLISRVDTIYFDSLSMLVFLLASSRFWLKRIQQHHLDVSHLEDYLLMGTVQRLTANGQLEQVSSLSLRAGDVIEISGDQVVPADGSIVEGSGFVQNAVLTGEVSPCERTIGDRIDAGSRNLTGTWRMRVENPAAESRLARILADADRSTREKPKFVLLADTVSQWFIGTVFAVAVVIALWFTFFLAQSQPHEGLSRALALIIVTCPCVFGMAIPLSMSLAVRAAAARGMIVKSADTFERLSQIRSFFFDKTGTLTLGDLRVLNCQVIDRTINPLIISRTLEEGQPHPIARAILKYSAAVLGPSTSPERLSNVSSLPGGGIRGRINNLWYSLRPLGSHQDGGPSHSSEQIKAVYGLFAEAATGAEDESACSAIKSAQLPNQSFTQQTPVSSTVCSTVSSTVSSMTNDSHHSRLIALFEIGDEIRPEAKRLLAWVRARGSKITLLSGDRASTVEACGRALELRPDEIISAATPEQKSSQLKQLGAQAMMIGDGANDAAALAAAGVGVAVRGSMDVSLRAADVYMTRSPLDGLVALFEIARRTRRAIVRNLCFSAAFNVAAGGLAVFGLMTPLWAAVLMPVSSLTVLLSALLTGRHLGAIERSSFTQAKFFGGVNT